MTGARDGRSTWAHRRPIVRIRSRVADTSPPLIGDGPMIGEGLGERPPFGSAARRIGLLGGSFNPAHDGHRAISIEALRRLGLDQVWWLVSPQNPLKSKAGMADLAQRMASAQAVVAGHPRITVTDLERTLGTRYSVDTIKRLQRDGAHHFVWLIGSDNLLQLPKWRDWQKLLNLVPIAVFDREPYSYRALAGHVAKAYARQRFDPRCAKHLVDADPPAWVYFRLRRHRISSTGIRRQQGWPTSEGAGSTAMESGTTEGASS